MGRLKYKGYTGSVDFDNDSDTFVGKVLGLKHNLILFEGDSVDALKKDFEESIDFYLQHCFEKNIEPEKPYSGNVVLRMTSDLHEKAVEKAASLGISLNEFIKRAISSAVL